MGWSLIVKRQKPKVLVASFVHFAVGRYPKETYEKLKTSF
jgi:hypothetical protein